MFQKEDVHETQQHCHPANSAAVEAEKAKASMRTVIQSTRTRPGQVLASATMAVSMEARLELGNVESRKRNLRRQKRKALPAEPAELKDLQVDGEWAMTGGPNDTSAQRPFLIYDSGADRADRIVVFSSPEQLRHLALADTWFMDGTFSTAPNIFTQVYVIRVPLDDSAVTCAYAFMTGISNFIHSTVLFARGRCDLICSVLYI